MAGEGEEGAGGGGREGGERRGGGGEDERGHMVSLLKTDKVSPRPQVLKKY